MRKKLIGILVCMLLTATLLPATALAGDEENPEITDPADDAAGNLDINSVWFSEKPGEPNYLFLSMKINTPNLYKIQQTFAVSWEYEGHIYGCGAYIGLYIIGWESWSAGEYINSAPSGGPNYFEIEKGTYEKSTGIITWKISKEIIGNPQLGDVLTKTWSNAFQRYGFLGLIGFSRPMIELFFFKVLDIKLVDIAPDAGYGLDYIIQY
jgi:hypothetical protein